MTQRPLLAYRLAGCLLALSSAATVTAQCTNPLVPFGPGCGVGGEVSASIPWDPDGPGPLPERLLVGGTFPTAGNVVANNIAAWDPATGAWSALGGGCNSKVFAVAVLPNGDVVAAGQFNQAGGAPADRIARWDGVGWSALGSGFDSSAYALTVLANGDVIASGPFTQAGGVAVAGIARWDGTSWSALASGPPIGLVRVLAALPNGDLVAGGPASCARWNGTTWSVFGVFSGTAPLASIITLANGDLLVGGGFTHVNGVAANGIARWNGTSWSALGSGPSAPPSPVAALRSLPNGDIVAAWNFLSAGGVAMARAARWDGASWSPMGGDLRGYWVGHEPWSYPNLCRVSNLTALANGAVIVGGYFSVAGAAAAQHVARWDGVAWSALSTGPGVDEVADLTVLPNGDVIAVGSFEAAGTLVTTGVARWNGTAWSNLGSSGLGSGFAAAVVRLPNGDLVVGGSFTSIGGVPASKVARWDGTQWSAMGAMTTTDEVRAFAVAPNGTLFAGGYIGNYRAVAAWNGTAWVPVGNLGGPTYALTMLPDGRLAAGGFAFVRVWNGTSWNSGPSLDDTVHALAVLPNGDLVAAPETSSIARWNGTSWSAVGNAPGTAKALWVLPDGDLLAGGFFSWGLQQNSMLARWNGASWSGIGIGPGFDGRVGAFASTPNGDVQVGGTLRKAGGVVSQGMVRLTTTCPATAQVQGVGCASSGGANTLVATAPAWVSATFRARGTGMPALAVVLALTSFAAIPQGTAPLATFFAQSPPGCDLLVAPDIVQAIGTTNGIADSHLFLPNTPPLVGLPFFHQMIPVEVDAGLNILAITATNSLRLVAGDF